MTVFNLSVLFPSHCLNPTPVFSEISPRRPSSSKRAFDCLTVPLGVAGKAIKKFDGQNCFRALYAFMVLIFINCPYVLGSKATLPVVVMNLKHILMILSPTRSSDQPLDQAATKSSTVSSPEPPISARHRRIFSGQSRPSTKAKTGAVDEPVVLSEAAQKCLRAAKVILGLLVTEDDAYAVSIRNLLDIPPPTKTIALGLRG